MVRWFTLLGDQYFGFWGLGLVLFAIQEIPYMLMPLFHLDANPIMTMTETSAALNICEKILGSLCIALTSKSFFREKPSRKRSGCIMAKHEKRLERQNN